MFYEQSDKRLYVNENSARTYRFPERLEQIVVEGDSLYVMFESCAYAYRASSVNIVDRVLKLNLSKMETYDEEESLFFCRNKENERASKKTTGTKSGMSAIYLSVRGENMDANQIQNLFASNVRQLLVDADLDYDKLYEIRLRVGRPLFLTYDGENVSSGKRYRTLSGYAGRS